MAGLIGRLLSEGRWHTRGSLPGLSLVVEVREMRRLPTASSRTSRVAIHATLVATVVESPAGGSNSRIRAALSVLLMLQRRALRFRDV